MTYPSPRFANKSWFVDSKNGSDSYNGSSVVTAFATLQKAHDQTLPGDMVFVLDGNGYGGGTGGTAPLVISRSGVSGSPITFTNFPGHRPLISGTQSKGAIYGINPLSYVNISGFELAGWQNSLTWSGAVTNAGASGSSWQSDVYSGYGVSILGSTGTSNIVHHISVTNCLIHDFPGNGIGINYCDYVTVTGNIVYNCAWYSPYACSGISLYEQHNIDSGTGTKCYVNNNIIFNCYNLIPNHAGIATMTTSAGTSAGSNTLTFAATPGVSNYTMAVLDITHPTAIPPGAMVYYYPSGTTMALSFANSASSASANVVSPGVSSGDTIQVGYITDGQGIIIDDNQNDQSDSVAYVGRTQVMNNVVYTNGGAGISIAYSNNCDVAFNTSYQNQTYQVGSSGAGGEIANYHTNGSNFYNNICVALASVPSVWDQATGTTTWSHNLFYGGNASHTLPGTGNVTTDPQFMNAPTDFRLKSTSPAIDAAVNTFTRATDLAGQVGLTGAAYDIGAYEYTSTPVAATPQRPVLDDPSNASGLGSPAILNGTVYAHKISGLTVGSGMSTGVRQANATALQSALTYAAANKKFFEIIPNMYEIYSSTGLTIPAGAGFVWRGSREGSIIRQFYPTSPGAPILTLGDNTNTNAIRGFDIDGAFLYYGVDQTGFTSANALVVNAAYWGKMSNINVHVGGSFAPPYRGMVFGGTAGTGQVFSVSFRDMYCFGAQQDLIYFNAPASTGNHFDNVYLSGPGGGLGTFPAIGGSFVNIPATIVDLKFTRLNCEWAACNNVINSGSAVNFGLTFDALHLEGVKLTGFAPSIFNGNGILVNSCELQDLVVQSANLSGTPTVSYQWPGGQGTVLINNLNLMWSQSGYINTAMSLFDPRSLDDNSGVFEVRNGMVRDPTGTGQGGYLQFDAHMPRASFTMPTAWGEYSYGTGGSRVTRANIWIASTYTHYGQHENATIQVPPSITSFNLTLAATQGATGTQPTRVGNTVRVRRQSGTASGTLTVKDDAGTTLSTNTTSATDLWYIFNGTHYVTFTPVT